MRQVLLQKLRVQSVNHHFTNDLYAPIVILTIQGLYDTPIHGAAQTDSSA
jgi:hypothetical protein